MDARWTRLLLSKFLNTATKFKFITAYKQDDTIMILYYHPTYLTQMICCILHHANIRWACLRVIKHLHLNNSPLQMWFHSHVISVSNIRIIQTNSDNKIKSYMLPFQMISALIPGIGDIGVEDEI